MTRVGGDRLTQLEDTDPPPTASSHIRTVETITGRRQIACYVSVIVQKDCVCIFELGECSIPYAATMEDGPLFESHQGRQEDWLWGIMEQCDEESSF